MYGTPCISTYLRNEEKEMAHKLPALLKPSVLVVVHLKECLETRRISVGSQTVPTVQKNHYCPRKMIPKWDANRKWWGLRRSFSLSHGRKIYNKTSLEPVVYEPKLAYIDLKHHHQGVKTWIRYTSTIFHTLNVELLHTYFASNFTG